MISEIQFNADLGKSDHLLQYFFYFNCYNEVKTGMEWKKFSLFKGKYGR